MRAQFGDGFRPLGAMRRRRNALEYPSRPGRPPPSTRRGSHPRRRGAASGSSAVVAYQFHLQTGTGRQLPEGPLAWESVAHGWSRALWSGPGRQETEDGVYESPTVATLFVFGAGDGNRTRTVSLGRVLVPGCFPVLQRFWRPQLAVDDPSGLVSWPVWPCCLGSRAEAYSRRRSRWVRWRMPGRCCRSMHPGRR